MTNVVRPVLVAGIAVAGASFWLAASPGAAQAHAAPPLVSTSVDAPLAPPLAVGVACGADPLCVLTGASNPPKLAAALVSPASDPAANPVGVLCITRSGY